MVEKEYIRPNLPASARQDTPNTMSKRILIVDDEADIRMLTAGILEDDLVAIKKTQVAFSEYVKINKSVDLKLTIVFFNLLKCS